MKPYRYRTLPTEKGRIRLVSISPRSAGELYVRIFQITLRPEKVPSYGALSYVWGATSEVCQLKVRIEAKMGSKSVGITRFVAIRPNLLEALHNLRADDQYSVYWIDSICINQADPEERARAIVQMADIYRNAQFVTAYLGPSNTHSKLAFDIFRIIGQNVKVDWRTTGIERVPSHHSWTAGPEYDEWLLDINSTMSWQGPEALAIHEICDRPWFERLWVRQEIFLGQKNAAIQCGQDWLNWHEFCRGFFLLTRKTFTDDDPSVPQKVARRHLILDVVGKRFRDLEGLLDQMRKAKCTDPRDRVYGILGMLQGSDQHIAAKILPDYSKSVVDVFRDVILAQLQVYHRVDLLMHCNGERPWSPTWVPDWTVGSTPAFRSVVQKADADAAAAAAATAYSDQSSATLSLQGCIADIVAEVRPFPCSDLSQIRWNDNSAISEQVRLMQDMFRNFLHGIDLQEPSRRSGDIIEAIIFALETGSLQENMLKELWCPRTLSLSDYKLTLTALISPTDIDPRSLANTFILLSRMNGRGEDSSMIISETGYIGFGPRTTRPGDSIVVLLGCLSPLILRPVRDTEHTVVGPAYIHGLETGQLLLGPLPKAVRMLLDWDAQGHRNFVFENRETGKRSVLDPRIEWDALEVEPSVDSYMTVIDEEHILRAYRQPDITYFRTRGVAFETFELI